METENKKPENPFAFAMCDDISFMQHGMTLRDYFAAKAMQGFITKYGDTDFNTASVLSYQIADAMLKQRLKNEFDANKQENDNPWRKIELGTDLPKEKSELWVVCQGKVYHIGEFDPEIEMSVRYFVDHYSYWKYYIKPEFNPNLK